jgi:hypothetical protein
MNSSLQDGAENAMSIRIGYSLPTRKRVMAEQLRRCWNRLSELSAYRRQRRLGGGEKGGPARRGKRSS